MENTIIERFKNTTNHVLTMKKNKAYNYFNAILVVLVLAVLLLFAIDYFSPAALSDYTQKKEDQVIEESEEQTSVYELSTILPRARNIDLDTERDGIEVILSPKDKSGNLVPTDGTVSAKLWYAVYDESNNRARGQIIQEWNNVPVSIRGYDDYGYKTFFEFTSHVPEPNEYGFFDIILRTPDGNTFAAKEALVVLGIIS